MTRRQLVRAVEVGAAIAGLLLAWRTGRKINAKANADVRSSWAQASVARDLHAIRGMLEAKALANPRRPHRCTEEDPC